MSNAGTGSSAGPLNNTTKMLVKPWIITTPDKSLLAYNCLVSQYPL